eukprot:4685041-Amphidinium_carterae.1
MLPALARAQHMQGRCIPVPTVSAISKRAVIECASHATETGCATAKPSQSRIASTPATGQVVSG